MGRRISESNSWHLRRDPNDPRNVPQATVGDSLNNEPEAEVKVVEVQDVETDNTVTHIGVDPNDVRLVT